MPLFEVTLSDGTTRVMQAHNKRDLRAALEHVTLTSIDERKRCRAKNEESGARCQEVATVSNRFCASCWAHILTEFHKVWGDIDVPDKEFESLVMSYFVEE